MFEPVIRLPENPTKNQVLYAALCASNYSDQLMGEALKWREKSHELYEKVDEICEKHRTSLVVYLTRNVKLQKLSGAGLCRGASTTTR